LYCSSSPLSAQPAMREEAFLMYASALTCLSVGFEGLQGL